VEGIMARFLEVKDAQGNKKIINVEQIAQIKSIGDRILVSYAGLPDLEIHPEYRQRLLEAVGLKPQSGE
jgi:hypothetical protein